MAITLKVTEDGIKELLNATRTGIKKITLSQVAVGSGQYTPTGKETALKTEIKKLNTTQASTITNNEIRVNITDTTADTYNVGEIGIYTDTGVLFAVYSKSGAWVVEKSGVADLFIETIILLTGDTAANITFGDFVISNNLATTEKTGIARFATPTEVTAGTAKNLLIAPADLANLSLKTNTTLSQQIIDLDKKVTDLLKNL